MTDELTSGDPHVDDFLLDFGETAARVGLTWDETEALFNRVLDAGNAAQQHGCTCKLQLVVDMGAETFALGHYPECSLHSQRPAEELDR